MAPSEGYIHVRGLGQRIVARLRERTYAAAMRQEVEFVEKGEGDVLSRLSADSSIVGESVTNNLSDGLRASVMSIAGLGAMFYISPQLTLLMLGIVPPVSLGAWFYGRYLRRLSNKTQEALGEMTKVSRLSVLPIQRLIRCGSVFVRLPKSHCQPSGPCKRTMPPRRKNRSSITRLRRC